MRADADANANPIPWDVYTEAQTEPEEETETAEPEAVDNKPRIYRIIRRSADGNFCVYAAFTTITKATAAAIDLSRQNADNSYYIYRRDEFFTVYRYGCSQNDLERKHYAADRHAAKTWEIQKRKRAAEAMNAARRSYTPPEPSNRDTIIAQTAAIMGDRIKIVKVGA